VLHADALRTTVQLVVGERCALAASSGLINAAPDEASKRFLATQTLDEARHVEIFTQRLYDLGVRKGELEDVIKVHANPNLVKFAEILLEKVDKTDFIAGVVGQNIVLEGMAFSVFEMMYAMNKEVNPKFAHTLSGTIADERRHVGFGENRIGSLIKQSPERKPTIERLQKDMSYFMLAAFADSFRQTQALDELQRLGQERVHAEYQGADLGTLEPAQMEHLLADTVLAEFKTRLGRIGIEYQTPARP
jgi:ribonucleotide reductase beta subunit family protein with ferritin-like domain